MTEANARQNRLKWLFTNFGLVVLAGLAGVASYAFNFFIARIWDAVVLGEVLGVFGAVSFFALPATLIILPMAKWSIRTADWKKKMPKLQGIALLLGLFMAGGIFFGKAVWENWLAVPIDWLIPALIWCIPVFVFYLQLGVFMGRRAYWWMGIIGAVPHLGKCVLLLAVFVDERLLENPSFALWAIALPKFAGAVIGAIGIYTLTSKNETVDLPKSLWASGWVSVATNAWMTWDSALAYIILSKAGIGIYGVMSTLGKIPFYLASNVANMGINEKIMGKSSKYGTEMVIVGLGVASILGFLVMGEFLMGLFGLEEGLTSLLVFLGANTLLSLIYYQLGVDAQKGYHTWYPLVVTLGIWTVWMLMERPGHIEFVLSMSLALFVSWIGIWLVRKRYQSPKRML